MRTYGNLILAFGFVPVMAVLTSGCATKGYVNSRLDEVRLTTAQRMDSLGRATDDVRNSADAAMQRAVSASESATQARELALGKLGYQEAASYTVHFKHNSDDLTEAGRALLDEAAVEIQSRPEYLVDVYGFTDSKGSDRYNLDLGKRRADTVLRYMLVQTPGQLRRYAAVSFGKGSVKGKEPTGPRDYQRRQVVVSLVRRIPPSEMNSAAATPIIRKSDETYAEAARAAAKAKHPPLRKTPIKRGGPEQSGTSSNLERP